MTAQPWDPRLARLEGAYEQVDRRLTAIDARLETLDRKIDALEAKVTGKIAERIRRSGRAHALLPQDIERTTSFELG